MRCFVAAHDPHMMGEQRRREDDGDGSCRFSNRVSLAMLCLRQCGSSHAMSSSICLKLMSFLQNAATIRPDIPIGAGRMTIPVRRFCSRDAIPEVIPHSPASVGDEYKAATVIWIHRPWIVSIIHDRSLCVIFHRPHSDSQQRDASSRPILLEMMSPASLPLVHDVAEWGVVPGHGDECFQNASASGDQLQAGEGYELTEPVAT